MANVLSELAVKITADISKLKSGLADAEKATQSFGSKLDAFGKKAMIPLLAVGTVITGTLGAATMSFANTADELDEMSQRTGLSTKRLQVLGYAAKLTGSSVGGMETAIKKMQKAAYEAANGNKAATKTFEQLGIKAEDFVKIPVDEQLDYLADLFAEMDDPMERTTLAMDLFGRSGTDLLPILIGGLRGLQNMTTEAEKMGLILSDKGVKAGANMKDSLDKMGASVEGLKNKIGEALAPILTQAIEKITLIIGKVGEWIAKNPEAVKAILAFGAALLVVVVALKAMAIAASIAQALAGPAGWAALAIGLALAGGAAYGVTKLFEESTPTVPKMASGGIVSSPTLAMVGESGAEAIVPLNQMGEHTTKIYLDGEQIADVVERRLGNKIRLSEAKNYV